MFSTLNDVAFVGSVVIVTGVCELLHETKKEHEAEAKRRKNLVLIKLV
jgi:hypothetical protein